MKYFILFLILLILFVKLIIFLGLFQQNGYKINKYFRNLKKHYLKSVSSYLEYVALFNLFLYSFNEDWFLGILVAFFLLSSLVLTEPLLIYPKITKRLFRLFITTIFIYIMPIIILKEYLVILLVETIFLPFIIVLASLINEPLERKIYKHYKKKYSRKINQINPLTIGITGSFGKTSTKNIIHEIINNNYYTYSTPKSYNTPMGICMSIKEMNDETEVFISELGATKSFDIKELVDFVPVDIGIITDIGNQHLESFKKIENVLKTKLEILESKRIKTLIINNDNIYLREYHYPSNIKIIRIGINNVADYIAKNIRLFSEGLSFDVYKKEEYLFSVKTTLLGKHNVYNLLFGIVVGELLNISINTIKKNISNIKPIDNRLSINNIGKIQILNDAFNSNVNGFKNAIEVLKLSSNRKILITPGIVDLGDSLKESNLEISKYLIEGIDYIYLIENEASIYIKDYFDGNSFKDYETVSSFEKAYKKALNKYEVSTILIENDLPDNYLRR